MVPMMALKNNRSRGRRREAGVRGNRCGCGGIASDCNPFISTPSAVFSRTLLVTFLLMTFNVNVCQVVEAAASASASAAAGIERRPSGDLQRPDGLKMHHHGK
uniref:Uncharacterized protein n=1 Tax=Anopheles coluzzii TaxID=1518534 RepID=A0A8W7PLC1_ANOCL